MCLNLVISNKAWEQTSLQNYKECEKCAECKDSLNSAMEATRSKTKTPWPRPLKQCKIKTNAKRFNTSRRRLLPSICHFASFLSVTLCKCVSLLYIHPCYTIHYSSKVLQYTYITIIKNCNNFCSISDFFFFIYIYIYKICP